MDGYREGSLEACGADEVAHSLEGVFEARDVGNKLEEHRLIAQDGARM